MPGRTPHVLIILDGWGHREDSDANAIALANTPVWDKLWHERPHTLISGSGLDVGLPDGQMGNSEVGHMNLGTGRVVDQDFTRITKAIDDGSFFDNPVLKNQCDQLKASDGALHLFALLSPGGVHSHEDHLSAAIKMAHESGVSKIYVHGFLDGRDVPPKSAEPSIQKIQAQLDGTGIGAFATLSGRYFAMDRDNRWERIKPAYRAMVSGEAEFTFDEPIEALKAAYSREETDEFVEPTVITPGSESPRIQSGDGILFMNFRADRAREITRAFTDEDFDGFDRGDKPTLGSYVTLTEYASDLNVEVAYKPADMRNSLGEYVANLGKKQLRIAETEKYAHVTFFFSGGQEDLFAGEERDLIPSPDVATYDLQPEMSAPELTDKLCAAIESGDFDLIVCNYANGDMVGHTGVLDAAIQAVECVDKSLGKVAEAISKSGGHCLITADHGNCEQMQDNSTGQPHTAHTSELVPLIYLGDSALTLTKSGGKLSDIAPTILNLMNLEAPTEMTGQSLVQFSDELKNTAERL
jgi:2,3-bisphosphoglycerate-independent phosphoglycerate mutase